MKPKKPMMVKGFNPDNPMALVGIRKHDIDPMAGDDDYLSNFAKLYPFAMVDFHQPHTHINDATDGEFHHPKPAEEHYYAEPEECDDCKGLEQRVEELEYDLFLERTSH